MLAHCRTCNKEVASTARTCPHCGQRSPVPMSPRLKKGLRLFFLAAGGLFAIGLLVAYLSDELASSGFKVGNSYHVAKLGHVCATTDDLVQADYHGVTTLAQAEEYNCVMIEPGGFTVTVLDKNAALVKVRVNSFGEADKFEGWTQAENISPGP
jgi:hypothetical protein